MTDDVTDHVEPEENLWVFGGRLPAHDAMRTIDRTFVPRAVVPLPSPTDADRADGWLADQAARVAQLRATTFRHVPRSAPACILDVRADGTTAASGPRDRPTAYRSVAFATPDGLTLRLVLSVPQPADAGQPTVVCALAPDERTSFLRRPGVAPELNAAVVEVRGTGKSAMGPGLAWTARRAYPLLGCTLPERQVADLLAGVEVVRAMGCGDRVVVYGRGYTAVLALYAAVLDPRIEEVVLEDPPGSHADPTTPELLHVLQTGDLAHNLSLVYPRAVTFVPRVPRAYAWTREAYAAVGDADRIRVADRTGAWHPMA